MQKLITKTHHNFADWFQKERLPISLALDIAELFDTFEIRHTLKNYKLIYSMMLEGLKDEVQSLAESQDDGKEL